MLKESNQSIRPITAPCKYSFSYFIDCSFFLAELLAIPYIFTNNNVSILIKHQINQIKYPPLPPLPSLVHIHHFALCSNSLSFIISFSFFWVGPNSTYPKHI